jgi:hypothetical protein
MMKLITSLLLGLCVAACAMEPQPDAKAYQDQPRSGAGMDMNPDANAAAAPPKDEE